MTATKTVNVFGDKIQVRYVGSMWVSPSNGQQHPEARGAMLVELEQYFSACGDDTESEEIREQIDGYISQMS